ncbi:MAG: OmpA family protein, partial [Pseudomonadota bacterium]
LADATERQAAEAAAAEALAAASRKREAARACQSALDAAAKSGVILFKSGLAVLEARSTATLDRLAAAARSCGNLEIRIAGHTDATGAADRNQKLSEDRARAVADYLAGKGVPAAGLKSAGFGATRPIAPNDTPAGRAKNRRIEFTVSTE